MASATVGGSTREVMRTSVWVFIADNSWPRLRELCSLTSYPLQPPCLPLGCSRVGESLLPCPERILHLSQRMCPSLLWVVRRAPGLGGLGALQPGPSRAVSPGLRSWVKAVDFDALRPQAANQMPATGHPHWVGTSPHPVNRFSPPVVFLGLIGLTRCPRVLLTLEFRPVCSRSRLPDLRP